MTRSFDGAPIPNDVLARVLAATAVAPSAGNVDALDLVTLVGPEQTERYWSTTMPDEEARRRFGWPGLFQAPVLVLAYVWPDAYPQRYAEPDKVATGLGAGVEAWPVPYWWVDGGGALTALLLAAEAEGLGACLFGQFSHEPALSRALGVPDDRRALGTIALGWPTPGGHRRGRSAGRPRREDIDRVHPGAW